MAGRGINGRERGPLQLGALTSAVPRLRANRAATRHVANGHLKDAQYKQAKVASANEVASGRPGSAGQRRWTAQLCGMDAVLFDDTSGGSRQWLVSTLSY